MSDRTDLENEIYHIVLGERIPLILSNRQRNNLIKIISTLRNTMQKYYNIMNSAKLKFNEILQTEEVAIEIEDTYIQFDKGPKEYEEILSDNLLRDLLENLDNNSNIFNDILLQVEKEELKVIEYLNDYNPNIDILKNLFSIKLKLNDIWFLVTLSKTYFYQKGNGLFYIYFNAITEILSYIIETAIGMYMNWEESERGC